MAIFMASAAVVQHRCHTSTFKADRIPAEAEEDCSLKIRSEGCGDSLYYVRKHALS